MANVKFYRGNQASLPKSVAASQAGSFYLTKDSDRLYIVNDQGKLNLLNKAVQVYDDVATLTSEVKSPVEGDFYYARKENVLCTWAAVGDGLPSWRQINADTNTEERIEGFAHSTPETASSIVAGDEKFDVTSTITVAEYNKGVKSSADKEIEAQLAIPLATSNLTTEESASSGIIAPAGKNIIAGTKVTVTGTGATKVSSDNAGKVTISSTDTKYSMTKTGDTVTFKEADSNVASCTIKFEAEAANPVELDTTGNTIKYSHAEKTVSKDTATGAGLVYGGTIAIPTVDTDKYGHVSKITTTSYKLPDKPVDENTTYRVTTSKIDSDGKIVLGITGANNGVDEQESTVTSTEAIHFSVEDVDTVNGGTLDTYKKATIDDKIGKVDKRITTEINQLNAMVYMGIVDGTDSHSVPKTKVRKGDTYKVAAPISSPVIAKKGDLIIANGTENEGFITGETLTWDVIPSGDEEFEDSTYSLDKIENGAQLTRTNGSGTAAGSITFSGDAEAKVAVSGSDNSTAVAISHATHAAQNGDASGSENSFGTMNVVTKVVSNGTGHVTEVATGSKKYATYDIGAEGNVITLTGGSAAVGHDSSVTLAGGNLITASTAGGTITFDHDTVTTTKTDGTAKKIAQNGKFKAVTGYNTDDYGHLTEVVTTEFTLPETPVDDNYTYALSGATRTASGASATFTHSLTGSNGGASSVSTSKLSSSTLKFAAGTADNEVKVNLEWETF